MSAMMIKALKITAERIADCGVRRPMMLSALSTGNVVANIAGMIAKYFATSLTIENVVNAPRVINNCFPISTTSISFVGLLSRSTMLPASFAACLPALDERHLFFGRGLGQKIVDTGFACDRLGRERIVTRDHDRPDAHL